METLGLCFSSSISPFFFFFFFLYPAAVSLDICNPFSCNTTTGPDIHFPFRITTRQSERCGYPGFELFCNTRNQTVVNLPSTGEFIVSHVNYVTQTMYIYSEPCHARKLLHFSLGGTPFRPAYHLSYTFYNCTTSNTGSGIPYPFQKISCLSGNGYGVIAVPTSSPLDEDLPANCRNISRVNVPVRRIVYEYGGTGFGYEFYLMGLADDIPLTWGPPSCGACEAKGGLCGFKRESGNETGCSNLPPRRGLSRGAKYGVIVGVGIPGLVCLIGLVCFICNKVQAYDRRSHRDTNPPATMTTLQLTPFAMGLDSPTIESYPKTILGESRRLPKPSDGTCSICLSEYEPKDTLRTIPECNHYFHANCVDEWLKLNATCPVCRNTPEGSSVVTPSSSVSSSVSSSAISSSL